MAETAAKPAAWKGHVRRLFVSFPLPAKWSLAALVLAPLALLRAGTLAESDTFWEVRAGQLILDTGAVPVTDTLSWTAEAQPWTLNSWGFDAAMALCFRIAGLAGVAAACACLVLAIFALLMLAAKRLGASPLITAAIALFTSPLLIAWLSARPQLVDYIGALLLGLVLSDVPHGRRRLPWLALLGCVSALWANAHAGVLLGIAIAGAAAVVGFAVRRDRARAVWHTAAACVMALGALANPYGPGLFVHSIGVRSASSGVMTEWAPIDLLNPLQVLMACLGMGALLIALRRQQTVYVAALGVTLIGGFTAIRLLPVALLLAVPVLAAAASRPPVHTFLRRRRVVFVPPAFAAAALVAALGIGSLSHLGRPAPELFPARATAAIPAGCDVFNSMNLGGFVILERPDVKVSLDSRNDLYGAELVAKLQSTLEGRGDLRQNLEGAGCALLSPGEPLAQVLAASPQWRLASSEPAGQLFVRR